MKFELPQMKHKQMFEDYKNEAYDHHEMFINGDGGCSRSSNYEEWLISDQNFREEHNIPEGYVGGTTYFVVDNEHQLPSGREEKDGLWQPYQSGF